jgi:cell volume regulation protein A
VHEILYFGTIVLVVGAAFALALVVIKLTRYFPIPSPVLFLLAAALVSDLYPSIDDHFSIRTAERIGVVALVVILFDGGMDVGWRRFRRAALPIGALGIVGTFATAAVTAVAAHYVFSIGWTTAAIIGAALAPTDPAVMFSVLGNKEVAGRSSTILEGESGANDPVGIALMIAVLDYATKSNASPWGGVGGFALAMVVGLAVGAAGAAVLVPVMRRFTLPREGLYPLRTLAAALSIYGLATVAHGSGFLAVFVAGLLVGDIRAPYKIEIEQFHKSLASLGEIVVFTALGLTISLGDLGRHSVWLEGLGLALLLAFVIRPLVVAPLLAPVRLRLGERVFVLWGGLKGAVPILLGALVVLQHVHDASRVYGIVFVVVTFSVVVQGSSMPFLAAPLGVRMRTIRPEPWTLSVRTRTEPRTVRRYRVGRHSKAAGEPIRELPIGKAWVSMLIREGEPHQPRGSTVIEPGDEVVMLAEAEDERALRHLFEGVPAETEVV